MMDRSLIKRYVTAVYALSAEAEVVERVRAELLRLQWAMEEDPRMPAILRHPEVGAQDKRRILLRLAADEPSEVIAGFVDVILDKERVDVLLGVGDVFTEIADEQSGMARAHVEVAWEPDDDQRERLQTALSRLLGKPVVADIRLNPDVIGGVRVRVEGRLIDGSIDGHLTRMIEHVRSSPMPAVGE